MITVLIDGAMSTATLSMIDQITGVDWVNDFIGNHGAFNDGQFSLIEGSDVYVADQATFSWWAKVLTDHQAQAERISDVKSIVSDNSEVDRIVSAASECDLKDQAVRLIAALDEAY
ncbi:hypothetical protein OM416_19565 [Paenibacillus sp. LS1]|uniref:hypothetical protein n=1 Tax=Paenibacillus sp. LS1 TaxID=2992120 RepID=UPI00222F1024|nr:hypothetical protein [Paenibacillus sp. LS1]MCW3793795.1 hypothetical protein [Paenibacillus sp. LS1]